MATSRCETPNTMLVLAKGSTEQIGDGPNNRPVSRNSFGSRAGIVDARTARRTPTPSKQVSLTSVQRKDQLVHDSDERPESASSDSTTRLNGFYGDVQGLASRLNQPAAQSDSVVGSVVPGTHETKECTDILRGRVESSEDTPGESQDSSGEEEGTPAPSQLLIEFVTCVMEQDYQNAEKLCKMILLYEPDNPEALKFQPLIEEKLQQEEAKGSDDNSEEDSDDDGDSDDETDDDDSDDDSSDESSDQSASDDDGGTGETVQLEKS